MTFSSTADGSRRKHQVGGMMTRQQPDGKITELLLILLTICFNSFCHVLVLFKLRTFESIYWLIFFFEQISDAV